ncbi:hypothetical protein AB4354_22120 [Vibrio splendidus]|uniref:hypothetical protein n=1 Tax=Vibrio splendidus TaxID=29497 RepID=UPI000C8674B2|nr:hypothetical protein [Vibrio splendidus]PMH06242.1 hypothetical protein BCU75_01945 [Vibrio splendidus]
MKNALYLSLFAIFSSNYAYACPIGPFHCTPPKNPVGPPIGVFMPVPMVPVLTEIQKDESLILIKDKNNSVTFYSDKNLQSILDTESREVELPNSTLYQIDKSIIDVHPDLKYFDKATIYYFSSKE